MGRDVFGGDRPGLFPGLPLLRRRVCLPPAPGAAALEDLWTQVEPGVRARRKIGLVGAAVSDHPDIRELCRKILAAGGRSGDQFAPGRLRRRRAPGTPGPGRGAQRRPGPGGRQRPPAPCPQQGPHPGRPGEGGGGREPGRDSASSASTSWWACPPRPWIDVAEIPRLAKFLSHSVIKASQGKQHLGLITLSLSSFVPKPFTPFQWTPFLEVAELKKRLKLVAREFHGIKAVRVHTDLPKWAYVQALLARGDRRVADILLAAHTAGLEPGLPGKPHQPGLFHVTGTPRRRTLPLGLHRPRPEERLFVGGIPAGPGRQRNPALPAGGLQPLRGLRRRGEELIGREGAKGERPFPSTPPTPYWAQACPSCAWVMPRSLTLRLP